MHTSEEGFLPTTRQNQFTVLFYRLSLFFDKTAKTGRKQNCHFPSEKRFLQNCKNRQKPSTLSSPSLSFHALSASWWLSRVEFECRNFPDGHLVKARASRLPYTKAGSNTSRKVLEKLVDAVESPRAQKLKLCFGQ
jgi:hypothetical protein